MKKIKIGFLINGNFVDKYNYELAKWVKKNNDKFVNSTFISIPENEIGLNYKKILKKILFKVLIFIEIMFLKILNKHKNHFVKFDLRKVIKKKIEIKNTLNDRNHYLKEDLDKVKSENFDIIIRACNNILKGEFLKCSKFGIISFHHGDYSKYRGSPAGFWEVFFKEKNTGFIIQKIDKSLDYGNIISEGYFFTQSFFLLNQAELFYKSQYYLKKVLLDIHNNKKINFIKKKKPGKIFEIPKIYNQIIYLVQIFKRIFVKLFFKRKVFKLALFDTRNLKKTFFIKNYKKNFLADPFLFKENNKTFCFAEEYDSNLKKGKIVCLSLINNSLKDKKTIIDEKFHLSFPFIFKFNNKIFMCPDTSQISEIRLYICIKFPYKWKFYKTIKKNIQAVDTLILKKNKKWWMLTNIDRSNSGDYTHDLSIFYSKDTPLTNNWTKHSLNPIITNSLRSRNGGLVYEKKQFIRISQKQGLANYGENINFNKITTVSTKKYSEKTINFYNFSKIKKLLADKDIHHFSKIDNKIIVDFK